MRLELDMDEVCTLIAALGYYVDNDQGEPECRTDSVHIDATGESIDYEVMSSLDNAAVCELYESIKKKAKRTVARVTRRMQCPTRP